MKIPSALVAVLLASSTWGSTPTKMIEWFGSAETCDTIGKADRVDVRSLALKGVVESKPKNPLLYSLENVHFIEDLWIAVPQSLALELAQYLLSDSTYPPSSGKGGCNYIPQVQLRFSRGQQYIDVFLSFKCDAMSVRLNGKEVFGRDFDGASDELFSIVRKLLPGDASLIRIDGERDRQEKRQARRRRIQANQSPQHNAGIGPAISDKAPPLHRAMSSEETARPQSPRG